MNQTDIPSLERASAPGEVVPGASGAGATLASPAAWQAFLAEWASTTDYPALLRLSRRAEVLAASPEIASQLVPARLAIVSSATVDFLLPVLRAALMVSGIRPTVYVAPYGNMLGSLVDVESELARYGPQVTLLLTAPNHLPAGSVPFASLAEVEAKIDDLIGPLLDACGSFHERTGSEIVINNFHPLPWRSAGNLGAKLPGDTFTFTRRLNLALGDRAPRFVHINDVASLAERHGLETWFDERYWFLAKQPLSFDCVSDYCHQIAAVVGAVFGRSRKCLVLDLDNTLWGGVVGDDGLSGLELGEGSAVGEAYLAFQRYVRELKERGVLLAACSKNDERVAKSVFDEHPEMLLRLEDFVAFKANWLPKSENIRAIARELSLPVDALVFVDDNAAERAEVSQALPEVLVLHLPDDPGQYPRALDRARCFESVVLTHEDVQRTATYHARKESIDALSRTTDLQAYLRSLDMEATIAPFDQLSSERVTQLVNKTNQFNLTTPRLTLAAVLRLASDPTGFTRTIRLHDRFADHGVISVIFGRVARTSLLIEAWLMSCRVLGRGVERLVFNNLLALARDRNVQSIVGIYKPTKANGLVRDHYARLGFVRVDAAADEERWQLEVVDAIEQEVEIRMRSIGEPHDR
jgi:FkbH-like protein